MSKNISTLQIKIFAISLISLVLLFSLNLLADLNDGLVAYYPFTNGSTQDFSGNGNHGTNHGATSTTDRFGNENCAYYFDGINDYIDLPEAVDLPNQNFSISVFFNLGNYSSGTNHHEESAIYTQKRSTEDCRQLTMTLRNKFLQFDIRDSNCNRAQIFSPQKVYLNIWYHIIFIQSDQKIKMYINGNLVEETNSSNVGAINSNTHFIGAKYDDGNQIEDWLDGKIDNLRIYNRALSQSEIQQLYQMGNDFAHCYHLKLINFLGRPPVATS